jgi:hypothetical protein
MATTYPVPKNGACSIGSQFAGCDFASFDYGEAQNTESVAAYGAQIYDPHRGSGTPHASGSAAAFAKYGAANTNSFGNTALTAGGSAGTLTIDTGVTIAGTLVLSRVSVSHARLRAAVPLTFNFEGGGDMTITWPTS